MPLHAAYLFINNLRGLNTQDIMSVSYWLNELFRPCDSCNHVMNDAEKHELDPVTLCMEDQLRSLGILGSTDDTLSSTLFSKKLKDVNLDASTPQKKVLLSDEILILS